MRRQQLRSIGHTVAITLFTTGCTSPDVIRTALISACKEKRNFGMSQREFERCAEIFIPKELGRLARRQARAIAERACANH
jgi:adenylylsulfate kinase-like enzyme